MTDDVRVLPPVVESPVQEGGRKPCMVMTGEMVTTITLEDGRSYAAVTYSRPDLEVGAIAILSRDEVEAHVMLLRNAIDDAERANRGEQMIHASPSMEKH